MKLVGDKFFTHLGVKYEENVETTCKKLLLELDLTIEESLDKNGDQKYLFLGLIDNYYSRILFFLPVFRVIH